MHPYIHHIFYAIKIQKWVFLFHKFSSIFWVFLITHKRFSFKYIQFKYNMFLLEKNRKRTFFTNRKQKHRIRKFFIFCKMIYNYLMVNKTKWNHAKNKSTLISNKKLKNTFRFRNQWKKFAICLLWTLKKINKCTCHFEILMQLEK